MLSDPTRPSSTWRQMQARDLAAVDRIARATHPTLPERVEVFAEKLRLFPEGCFALESAERVLGYGLSHPWRLDDIPALDCYLGALPTAPTCLYLHDVAILPEARGAAAAARLIASLRQRAQAEGLGALALVSVHGADRLWRRLGFAPAPLGRLADKLAAYGPTAQYMTLRV